MTVWVVRAGSDGEREDFALDNGCVVVGWDEVPSLDKFSSQKELLDALGEISPESGQARRINHAAQLWTLKERIRVGDMVVLPLKTRWAFAFGVISGPYEYHAEGPDGAYHRRPVEWRRTDIPRSAVDPDLRFSLGSALTVFSVARNNAEGRLKTFLSGGDIPIRPAVYEPGSESEADPDIEGVATDEIRRRISERFRGHELTRLVSEVLRAQGFETLPSPAGRDGGVDILASRGAMGFDGPFIAVQVKSSDAPSDVSVLRELQGVMPRFGASKGLVVSWGGFKSSVYSEARPLHFSVRLWDSGDLIKELLAVYGKISPAFQAELALKQVWTLVPGG